MKERNYLKMLEQNFEEALKILIATSTDDAVDLWELNIRDYIKALKEENIQNQ